MHHSPPSSSHLRESRVRIISCLKDQSWQAFAHQSGCTTWKHLSWAAINDPRSLAPLTCCWPLLLCLPFAQWFSLHTPRQHPHDTFGSWEVSLGFYVTVSWTWLLLSSILLLWHSKNYQENETWVFSSIISHKLIRHFFNSPGFSLGCRFRVLVSAATMSLLSSFPSLEGKDPFSLL